MPYGPNGQWRPNSTGAAAVHVCKLATGEIKETYAPPEDARKRQQASEAGKARASKLSPERRREIAKAGAAARWGT